MLRQYLHWIHRYYNRVTYAHTHAHTHTSLVRAGDVFEESSEGCCHCHFHDVGFLLCCHPFGGFIVTHLEDNHKHCPKGIGTNSVQHKSGFRGNALNTMTS